MNLPFAPLQGKTCSPGFRPAVGKGRGFGDRGTQLPQPGKNLQALMPGRQAGDLPRVFIVFWEEKGLYLLLPFADP